MKLYDSIIAETMNVLTESGISAKIYPYQKNAWKDNGSSEFIMQRDAGGELGSEGNPSVNYTLVTTSGTINENQVFVFGPDICEVKESCGFARIVILETEDLQEDKDTEKAFSSIRNLEFVRYHVFPKGYMVRVSASSNQEQIRISREALAGGISFAKVGSMYIEKYKELPEVKKVRVIFITEKELVKKLLPNAEKTSTITKTLTHILDGMPTDCGHCSMKPVCDEVEGMKELHLGKKKDK